MPPTTTSWGMLDITNSLALFPLGLHGRRLDDVLLGLVAPRVARVGDRRRDVDVGKLCPRRHLAAGGRLLNDTIRLPVQHDVDLMLLGTEHDLVADERGRADRAVARAVRLVAGGAIRVEDLLAVRDEVLQVPRLVGSLGARTELLLLLGEPLRVVVLRLHFDDDRHEAMLLAAELGALPAVDADLGGAEPCIADEARNRILLDAERRNPPR